MSICAKSLWPACKLILSASTPIQSLFDRGGDTHLFINRQATKILLNDGKREVYKLIAKHGRIIDQGNLWADKGLKYFAHYYRPDSHKGFIPGISAVNECMDHFNRAVSNWHKGRLQQSMFYLGAAAHIVQDLCVPHHSMGIAFNGHGKFEIWAIENKENFKVQEGGMYYKFNNLKEILKYNSINSMQYYNDVSHYNNNRYVKAAKELLPMAQVTTACLFNYFYGVVIQY